MSYLKKRTLSESMQIVGQLSHHCSLQGPLSRQLYNLFLEERYLDIIMFEFDYTWCFSQDDFLYARQIQALLSKQDFLDLGIDKEKVAYTKFLENEALCSRTNQRLENAVSQNWDVGSVLYIASQKITRILGQVPALESLDLAFGPGASTSTKSLIASPRVKLSSRLECSMNLVPLLEQLLVQLPMLCDIHDTNSLVSSSDDFETLNHWKVDVDIVPGKLAFVPKTCKEYRIIVVEPILNGLAQKGVGTYMKQRLLKAGLDLRDQSRNQRSAQKGSIDGSLSTIDLSSFSDTISRGVVWSLLPPEWAEFLDCLRSDCVTYKGEVIKLEKFSSMGNAYTFELASLILYALSLSVCEHLHVSGQDVTVYGDDIIIPTACFELLSLVLEECGFILNIRKTYNSGPFRESCGGDYLGGFDIRPFYLHSLIDDRTLYTMHNWFVRHCEFELANITFHFTHEPSRLFGPDGYGDGHLLGDHSLRYSRSNKRKGYCGGVFDTYTLKPKCFKKALKGDYVYPTYSIYVRGQPQGIPGMEDSGVVSDPYVVRGTRGYSKISIYTLALRMFSQYVTPKPEY